MGETGTESWRAIRERWALNEESVALYRLLMDAEARLEEVRLRRGVGEAALGAALEAVEGGSLQVDRSPAQSGPELYLAVLARYVASLGGRVELRARFPNESVVLWGDRDEDRAEGCP